MELNKNDIVIARVESAASGGEGVARIEGRAVFVRGALPGETCRARILRAGASAVWARAEEITQPSPHRIEPPCPYYPKCGGCALLHTDYQGELELKLRRVNDAFERIGGLELRCPEITGSPERFRYRNKAVFNIAARSGRAAMGFFRPRSHELIPVSDCLLQTPGANRCAQALREWMDECRVQPYDEETGKGVARRLMVRTNGAGQCAVCLVAAKEPRALPELVRRLRAAEPGLVSVTLDINPDEGNVILSKNQRPLWGSETLSDTLLGLSFRLSPASFFQVNRAQAQALYEKAIEFAAPEGGLLLDMYCGTGTIGLCAAARAGSVVGCEISAAAVRDAEENARANGVKNARFIRGDAAAAAGELAAAGTRPEAVIVDPPRKGLDPSVIEEIIKMAPERVVYVSCDPATLARDLRLFSAAYRPRRAHAFDMFPATAHVETVVLMTRE